MSDTTARTRPITVRPAVEADATDVRAIAEAAWRATYPSIIGSDAVERFIAQAYSEARVLRRIGGRSMWVASLDGTGVDAFLETVPHEARRHIAAMYARPDARGRGLGTALLRHVVEAFPDEDLSADVLVGNVLGEPFYVARGFEPGELLEEEIGGVVIEERRWWLRAVTGAGG